MIGQFIPLWYMSFQCPFIIWSQLVRAIYHHITKTSQSIFKKNCLGQFLNLSLLLFIIRPMGFGSLKAFLGIRRKNGKQQKKSATSEAPDDFTVEEVKKDYGVELDESQMWGNQINILQIPTGIQQQPEKTCPFCNTTAHPQHWGCALDGRPKNAYLARNSGWPNPSVCLLQPGNWWPRPDGTCPKCNQGPEVPSVSLYVLLLPKGWFLIVSWPEWLIFSGFESSRHIPRTWTPFEWFFVILWAFWF